MNGSVQLNDILKVIVFLMELEDLGIIWQHFSTECALPFPLVCLRGSVSRVMVVICLKLMKRSKPELTSGFCCLTSILKGHGESQSLKINSMININYVYHQLDNIMI